MPQTLFTPGPVPVPATIVESMSQPMIHHHSAEAKALFGSINTRLQQVFFTEQPVLTLSSSSTGAAEAAVCSLFNRGEKALVFNNGRFAERWARMLRVFGLNVQEIMIEWAKPVTAEIATQALHQHPDVSCIWLVHSETSTGALSDVQGIIASLRPFTNALMCVDAVSSLGVHELRMDDWDIDVLLCGSQKGFMLPPGLGFVALSQKAWQKTAQCSTPRFYFDLKAAAEAHRKNAALFTPAMSLLFGLDAALDRMLKEGMEKVWARHEQLATLLRTELLQSGYTFFTHHPSNALTTVLIPEWCTDIVQILLKRYAVHVAPGQDHLQRIMFRIGHIGAYTQEDVHFLASILRTIATEYRPSL